MDNKHTQLAKMNAFISAIKEYASKVNDYTLTSHDEKKLKLLIEKKIIQGTSLSSESERAEKFLNDYLDKNYL